MSFMPRHRFLVDVPPKHSVNPPRPRAVISVDRDQTRKAVSVWSHQQQSLDGAAAAVAPPFVSTGGQHQQRHQRQTSARDRMVEWMDDVAEFAQTTEAHERVLHGVLRMAGEQSRHAVTDAREAAKVVHMAARELQSLPHEAMLPDGGEHELFARCWEMYADCLPEEEASELRASRAAREQERRAASRTCRAVPLNDLRFRPGSSSNY